MVPGAAGCRSVGGFWSKITGLYCIHSGGPPSLGWAWADASVVISSVGADGVGGGYNATWLGC